MSVHSPNVERETTNISETREILDAVYHQLRRLASNYLRHERPDHTLQPTALVHEAYIRLADQDAIIWQSREHFIAMAATMMRRVLVNHAVRKGREKRGGGRVRIPLEDANNLIGGCDRDLVALDEALLKMAKEYPREAKVVEMRFFGGLSISETAEVLEVAETTVERGWRFARAWLLRELRDGP